MSPHGYRFYYDTIFHVWRVKKWLKYLNGEGYLIKHLTEHRRIVIELGHLYFWSSA